MFQFCPVQNLHLTSPVFNQAMVLKCGSHDTHARAMHAQHVGQEFLG